MGWILAITRHINIFAPPPPPQEKNRSRVPTPITGADPRGAHPAQVRPHPPIFRAMNIFSCKAQSANYQPHFVPPPFRQPWIGPCLYRPMTPF